HVDLHPCLERDRVDAGPTADTSHVERRLRLRGHLEGIDLGNGAAHSLDRVRHAERPVAMAARTLERDPITIAADPNVRDSEASAVYGNELIDLSLQAVEEQALHSAQIAEAFFTHVGHER